MNLNRQIKNAVKNPPLRFQWEVIRFTLEHDMRCFSFLDQGLGKTYSTLAALGVRKDLRPALIVCPSSLKLNWRKEAKMHIGEDAIVLSGQTPTPIPWDAIYVINYDIVFHWEEALLQRGFKCLVFDEFQACKNPKSKRTKSCKNLSLHVPHILGLTGTPVTNKPADLYSLLNIVTPGLFPSWWHYMTRYAGMKRRRWGLDTSGATNLKELHEKISPYMIRMKKEDVLKDLPPKQTIVLPVELSNRKEYDKAEADFLAWLAKRKPEKLSAAEKAEALVKLATLRQLVVEGKMAALEEWVDNFLENDKKLILFMCHKEPLHQIYNKHKKHAVLIDGGVSMKKRQEAVEKFQNNDKIKLFCGNIIAAGTGLTLTAADTAVFGELSYVPADHAQAADRHYRYGQEANNVSVYYLIADDSIEETVCEKLHTKMKNIKAIVDGETDTAEDWDFKKELLCSLKEKKNEA